MVSEARSGGGQSGAGGAQRVRGAAGCAPYRGGGGGVKRGARVAQLHEHRALALLAARRPRRHLGAQGFHQGRPPRSVAGVGVGPRRQQHRHRLRALALGRLVQRRGAARGGVGRARVGARGAQPLHDVGLAVRRQGVLQRVLPAVPARRRAGAGGQEER
jgi:hypothetical protein